MTSAVTKRDVLSVLTELYDSLGPIDPVIVTTKILISNIRKKQATEESSWDEPLLENYLSHLSLLAQQLPYLKNSKILRFYFSCKLTAIE